MNASPASDDLGASTAISFCRTSFSLTMIPTRLFASGGLVTARLGFHRLAALEARQKLVMRHRLREHRVVLLDRGLLLFLADGRRAVLERDDVIALLVPGPHGRLDAAIGEEAAKRDGRYAATAQNEIEIGGCEAIEAPLAFDDDIARLRLQHIDDRRAPSSLTERLAVDHALEDAVGSRAQLMVVVGKGDRRVDDRRAELARPFDRFDGVREHIGLVHHRLYRAMQRAALVVK